MVRLAINGQPLGRIVAGERFYFIPAMSCGRDYSLCIQNIAHSEGCKRRLKLPLASIAGFGVVGPCGPRTGNSSGILPGSSSGRAGSPGSRTGGGISGRGLPGGASGGGSVGLPGVAGGISGGSIGILCIANHVAPSLSRYRQR
jgi:hypothetical protein